MVSDCDLCGERERERMIIYRATPSNLGTNGDACSACLDLLADGHSGDCLACGADVGEPRATVQLADQRAPANALCPDCSGRLSMRSTGGTILPAPGARDLEDGRATPTAD